MSIVIVAFTAFLVAILTFFSGFGLGTLLTPVMLLFFPPEVAIALTGIVHFLNNLYKISLVGKNADKVVVLQFGIPAIIFAFLGAVLLLKMSDFQAFMQYELWGKNFKIYPIKLTIALLLIVFALMEIIPNLKNIKIDKKYLPIGGALSGLFGGLSGNQGALRSAFLLKAGLSKEAFIATGVMVSLLIDFTRLGVYSSRWQNIAWQENINLIVITTLAAIIGTFLGNKLLQKITIQTIQYIVAVLLLVVSVGIGLGWF